MGLDARRNSATRRVLAPGRGGGGVARVRQGSRWKASTPVSDPMDRPAAPVTCAYAPASGEGLPLSAVSPLAEGARRGRSEQVANTPLCALSGSGPHPSQRVSRSTLHPEQRGLIHPPECPAAVVPRR